MRSLALIILLLLCSLQADKNEDFGVRNDSPGYSLLHNPFGFKIDPMERLMLINIENDPDSVYIGFEPQFFDDDVHGKGHIIIGWRGDGRVDVYHQPAITLNPDNYDITGQGLANMITREMPNAHFEIDDFGAQVFYEFRDLHDRKIVLSITERSRRKRRPFALLAPLGYSAENPPSFPLFFMHDFYFVRRKHSEIIISIDDRVHIPDSFPLPMDWQRMYFSRYSADPLIVHFNPAFEGELNPLRLKNQQTEIEDGENNLKIVYDNEIPHIKEIIRRHNHHSIQLSFSPPFPSPADFPDNQTRKGSFRIQGNPATGSVEGDYSLSKKNRTITVTLSPSQGWKPKPTKLSLRFLYTVVKMFRNWPTTYLWTAVIHEDKEGNLYMESSWQRTGDRND